MALGATVHTCEVSLNDADRGVYEALSFRMARHPSEHESYLATRLLAYCLEYTEGLAFSQGGLSDPDAPALEVRDLTGALQAWIEVGLPDGARLHRAAKATRRVAVYPHRDVALLLSRLDPASIHRASELEILEIDAGVIARLAAAIERRITLDLDQRPPPLPHARLAVGRRARDASRARLIPVTAPAQCRALRRVRPGRTARRP